MQLLPSARPQVGNEQGFVLILTLVILMLLTLFGLWAMQTSDMETRVAANKQRLDQAVYFAEGSNYVESAVLGSLGRDAYKLKRLDPNRVLIPAVSDFDPFKTRHKAQQKYTLEDYRNAFADNPLATDEHYDNEEAYLQANSPYWPYDNLLRASGDSTTEDPSMDYQYLSTFVNAGPTPLGARGGMPGYSAENETFTSYWFRVQGRPAASQTIIGAVVESGAHKVGPNALQ